jgi:transposase
LAARFPEDGAAADWDVRFDRCVGQGRRGRLREGRTSEISGGTESKVWSGVDTGKAHHHCVVIDGEGRRLLSRRVVNDEPEVERLITEVTALGEEVTWAADMAGGVRRC